MDKHAKDEINLNKLMYCCLKNRLLFNPDLNRGCLVYMFSLRFSGSKFLINLQQQFTVTISKMHELCSRVRFH